MEEGYDLWIELLDSIYHFCEVASATIPVPFLDIYSGFKSALDTYQKDNDITYLSLLQMHIAQLNPLIVAEKSYMRVARYRYFLIDEFQDTSLSQWNSLKPILEEVLSQGGLLFCVGDPKQTIYRWRGSQPNIFQMLYNSFNANIKEFVLDKNWRSNREVVEFNNRLFSGLAGLKTILVDKLLDTDMMNSLAHNFSPERVEQKPTMPGSGKVELIGVKELNDIDDYVEAVYSVIQDRPELSDICVLVRTNSHARDVLLGLSRKGIPVISDE